MSTIISLSLSLSPLLLFWSLLRTWRNAQLGERIIMQLEEKGKQMTDELKGAIDKLNEEASALEVEKEKKEVKMCPSHFSFICS